MKYFAMDSLNRKALNKITMLHKMILNHSSELSSGFDLPLCREKNGAELSSKDFETLFGTYNYWRISNGLCTLSYITKLYEVGNISTAEKSVSVETFTIRVGSMALSTSDFEPSLDIPSEFAKRDGKTEKAKTAENNARKTEEKKTVEKAREVLASVSPTEELNNEDKALEKKAKDLNADINKDLQDVADLENFKKTVETFTNRIALIFGNDTTKEQKKAIADALKDFAQSF